MSERANSYDDESKDELEEQSGRCSMSARVHVAAGRFEFLHDTTIFFESRK